MENIEALFSFVAKTSIKMPMNLDKSLMEVIGSNSNWPIENFKQQDMDDIYNIFSLPDNELNLMTISHLYTMNDFGQFGRSDLFSALDKIGIPNKLSLGGVPKEFETCFKEMYNKTYGDRKEIVDNVFEQIQGEYLSPATPSPCLNSSIEHNCQSYCQWHKTFFDSNGKKKAEFLALMKLSQPQRKLAMTPFTEAELSLTEQVFGKTKDQSINDGIKSQMISSMPLLIFCKNKLDQEWLGDDIGMIANFCTDFYPTPTDQGICMTKNLNFYNFMELSKEFQQTFEVNVRFMSYSKCCNWRRILKLISNLGCLFTFCYFNQN